MKIEQETLHPSHVTRSSDASTFDEICVNCGARDALGTWGELAKPCPVTTIIGWVEKLE